MAACVERYLGSTEVRRRRPGEGRLWSDTNKHVHSLAVLLLLLFFLLLLDWACTESGRRRQLDLGLAPDALRIRRYYFHAA